MGLTSVTRVTMPRTVTSFPMQSALTSRTTRALAVEGALKYSSLGTGGTERARVSRQAAEAGITTGDKGVGEGWIWGQHTGTEGGPGGGRNLATWLREETGLPQQQGRGQRGTRGGGTQSPSHSQAPQQLRGVLILRAAGVPCVPAPLLQQQPVLDVHVQHILAGHLGTQGHRRKGGTSEGAAGARRRPPPTRGAPTSRSL